MEFATVWWSQAPCTARARPRSRWENIVDLCGWSHDQRSGLCPNANRTAWPKKYGDHEIASVTADGGYDILKGWYYTPARGVAANIQTQKEKRIPDRRNPQVWKRTSRRCVRVDFSSALWGNYDTNTATGSVVRERCFLCN
jgi:hypothetical protein